MFYYMCTISPYQSCFVQLKLGIIRLKAKSNRPVKVLERQEAGVKKYVSHLQKLNTYQCDRQADSKEKPPGLLTAEIKTQDDFRCWQTIGYEYGESVLVVLNYRWSFCITMFQQQTSCHTVYLLFQYFHKDEHIVKQRFDYLVYTTATCYILFVHV